MAYSEKVMDHFANPRNVGEMKDPSGVGEVGNSRCGDIMRMYIKVEGDTITDVKFKTFGCGAAIATSSMATELIKGKTIEDALKLTNQAVMEALDGEMDGVKFCKVNVDDERDLAMEFGIESIPTLLCIKGGKVVKRLVGYREKDALKKELEAL